MAKIEINGRKVATIGAQGGGYYDSQIGLRVHRNPGKKGKVQITSLCGENKIIHFNRNGHEIEALIQENDDTPAAEFFRKARKKRRKVYSRIKIRR